MPEFRAIVDHDLVVEADTEEQAERKIVEALTDLDTRDFQIQPLTLFPVEDPPGDR